MVALSTYAEEQVLNVQDDVSELTLNIDSRTFRQVRDLQVLQDSNRVILRGRSGSYYVKQLATHAVMELLPGARVENCIAVTR